MRYFVAGVFLACTAIAVYERLPLMAVAFAVVGFLFVPKK